MITVKKKTELFVREYVNPKTYLTLRFRIGPFPKILTWQHHSKKIRHLLIDLIYKVKQKTVSCSLLFKLWYDAANTTSSITKQEMASKICTSITMKIIGKTKKLGSFHSSSGRRRRGFSNITSTVIETIPNISWDQHVVVECDWIRIVSVNSYIIRQPPIASTPVKV